MQPSITLKKEVCTVALVLNGKLIPLVVVVMPLLLSVFGKACLIGIRPQHKHRQRKVLCCRPKGLRVGAVPDASVTLCRVASLAARRA